MFVKIYNQKGEEVGKTVLPKEIFEVKLSPDLLHQVVVSQMANRRQKSAHAKDRSEVRGGGRKPWRQKGTGRARHGSIRSPLWRGGGVTFGPRKERVFKKEIPKKMRRKALFMVLSEKAKNNFLIVLDDLKMPTVPTQEKTPKENLWFPTGQVKTKLTKSMVEILKKLPCQKNCLIALPNYDKNLILAARNIPKTTTIEARNLNALDLLNYKYLLMSKETIKKIKEIFLPKS